MKIEDNRIMGVVDKINNTVYDTPIQRRWLNTDIFSFSPLLSVTDAFYNRFVSHAPMISEGITIATDGDLMVSLVSRFNVVWISAAKNYENSQEDINIVVPQDVLYPLMNINRIGSHELVSLSTIKKDEELVWRLGKKKYNKKNYENVVSSNRIITGERKFSIPKPDDLELIAEVQGVGSLKGIRAMTAIMNDKMWLPVKATLFNDFINFEAELNGETPFCNHSVKINNELKNNLNVESKLSFWIKNEINYIYSAMLYGSAGLRMYISKNREPGEHIHLVFKYGYNTIYTTVECAS